MADDGTVSRTNRVPLDPPRKSTIYYRFPRPWIQRRTHGSTGMSLVVPRSDGRVVLFLYLPPRSKALSVNALSLRAFEYRCVMAQLATTTL